MLQRRRISGPLFVTAIAALAGITLGGQPPAPAAAAGEDTAQTVSIVHINDVHASIFEGEPGVGYARIAGYADSVRASNPNTLFLDAGDVFAGGPYAAVDEGAGLVPVLNSLGLDVMTLGNAEFTYGSAVLSARMSSLNYPALGGNMVFRDSQQPIAPTTTTLTLPNGMLVGIVGVTTPSSGAMGANDLKYIDAIEVAKQGVAQLQDQGVDILIGLVHLGELDPQMSSPALAAEISDFDVIIDGHSHTPLPNGLLANGTLIAQTGGYAGSVGRVDLTVIDGQVAEATASLYDREALAAVTPRPETQAAVEQLRHNADGQFAEQIGSTLVELKGPRSVVRTGEAAVANMFADAVREASGAEIALLSAGYVGGDVPPGPVTKRNLFEIARVDTGIITKRMTGQQILDFLERCSQTFPAESGEFIHISGASYRIDPDSSPRVHSVTVGEIPLALGTEYVVALPSGGAEFPGAVNAETLSVEGSATPMLESYFRVHSPVSPALEGRIRIAATPGDGGNGAEGGNSSGNGGSSAVNNAAPGSDNLRHGESGARLAETGAQSPIASGLTASALTAAVLIAAGVLLLARRRRARIT